MDNKTKSPNGSLAVAICCALALAGCATRYGEDGELLTREQREAVKVGDNMVQTSYDYSRPNSIAPDSKPVWILPVINSGWQPAKVDRKTGDWVGGHYSATVVEDGKWATLEEAELSGKPYILPGQTRPIIPVPLKDQSTASTGELNATTLEQKLARLENLERESASRKTSSSPSAVSLGNQAAIPTLPPAITAPDRPAVTPDSGTRPDPKPKMSIPGITDSPSQSSGTKSPSPTLLAEPPSLPPSPPPLPPIQGGEVLKKSDSSPTPASPSTTKEPLILSSPTPTPKYDAQTGEIILGYAPAGATARVNTPKGVVTVSYEEGGRATVKMGAKSKTVTLKGPAEKIKIKIPN